MIATATVDQLKKQLDGSALVAGAISPVEDDPAHDTEMLQWTRECWSAMRPHVDRAVYVNAVVDDAGSEAPAGEVYGENYERLRLVKKKYDPANFFAENSNIVL